MIGHDDHRLCVAPMMERTDRHCRYLLRLVAPGAWLYTEMVTAAALLRGDGAKLLKFDPSERPLALQLGGSDAGELAAAARLGEAAGFDEINLNVGCPSSRVQAGCFGAALMRRPGHVAGCVAAIREAVGVPVTVKTRLGVDELDSYEFLHAFVGRLADAGCRLVIVHARKAWLSGLSPKQNRNVPPLDYARVHRLKADFPALRIIVNGGLATVEDALAQLDHADGVMLGRAAYQDPCLLAELDAALHDGPARSRRDVLDAFLPYVERELARGTPLRAMARHLMGLCAGRPGGRRWRRCLSELPDGAPGLERLQQAAELCRGADSVQRR